MLNGATTKLRNAQAVMATARTKRPSEPAPSLLRLAEAAVERLRRVEGRAIGPLVSARRPRVNPGWLYAAPALCAAAMKQKSTKRLDELFAAEPDRLGRLSFEVAGLYFDWSKTHLDQ